MTEEFIHRDGICIENPEFTLLGESKKVDGRGTTYNWRVVTGISRFRITRWEIMDCFPPCFVLGFLSDIHHSMMTLEQARNFFMAQLAHVDRLIAEQEQPHVRSD